MEANELLELFQWASTEEVEKNLSTTEGMNRLKEELADVVIYCFSLANTTGIDLTQAVLDKIQANDVFPMPDRNGINRAHKSMIVLRIPTIANN